MERGGPAEPEPTAGGVPGEGAFVFDERITEYGYGDLMPLPEGARVGRAYLPLASGGPVAHDAAGIPFRNGPDADVFEEIIAVSPGDGQVRFEFAPKLSHYGLSLAATLSRDTIRGTWRWAPGRDTLGQGTFEMWRVPRTSVTDSAIARSRRGARLWASQVYEAAPEDTVLLPVPEPPAGSSPTR